MRMLRVGMLIFSAMVVSAMTVTTAWAQSDESLSPIVDMASLRGPSQPSSVATVSGYSPAIATGSVGQGTTQSPQLPLAAAPSQLISFPSGTAPNAIPAPPYMMQGAPAFSANPALYGAPQAYGGMPDMGMQMGGMPGMGMPMGGMPPSSMYGGMPNGVMPAMYGEGAPGMPAGQFGGQSGNEGGCPYCGGQGCEYCQGFDGGYGDPYQEGVLGGFFRKLLPYSEGGRCAPRWYDITADAMYLKRDNIGEHVDFGSFTPLILGGVIVLSSDNLDYQNEFGMRLTGSLQVLPGANVEFTYFGMFDWDSRSVVDDPTGQLFSVYSDFGAGVLPAFPQTDQSIQQSLRASSSIDNFEINLRRRWQGPNCRLQGSWLAGARYVYLCDDLSYVTIGQVAPDSSETLVRARNSLTGFQVGGDLWANIVPGISLGADLKAGVYGVNAKYSSLAVTSAAPATPLLEQDDNNDIAAVGEANLIFIWRLNPNWTLRGGFSAVYIDGVALSFDNFNTTNPFNGARTIKPIDDNGSVFYHGAFAGLEWMW